MKPISTPHAPAAIGPYSQAIIAGNTVYCSGQIALDSGGELIGGDVAVQTAQVIDNLENVLKQAGASLGNIVKATIYLVSMDDFSAVNAVYGARVSAECPPARVTVEVSRLPKDVLVEIDAIAVIE